MNILESKKMGKLYIVGLGPGDKDSLTLGTLELLKSINRVILRTEKHPTVDFLRKQGLKFETCDAFYEEGTDFIDVYQKIAEKISAILLNGEDVVYAVPGSPNIAEKTVELLKQKAENLHFDLQIMPAISFIEVLFSTLKIDPATCKVLILDVNHVLKELEADTKLVFLQVYNRLLASDLKLHLLDMLDAETEVMIVKAVGIKEQEKIQKVKLYELDRDFVFDHLTSVYVHVTEDSLLKNKNLLQPLVDVMAILRGKKGCAWDKAQNHYTLKRYLIEETYEVLEAIEEDDREKLCEELGDLLLQIVFHACMAEEQGAFTIKDVVSCVVEKMIRRHPHVFGEEAFLTTPAEVLVNWGEIKEKEKAFLKKEAKMFDFPKGLPSLMMALKIQEKVSKYGFDWHDTAPIWEKIEEELKEFKEKLAQYSKISYNVCEKELGDILFSVVNLARHTGFEPETALHYANNVFIKRFEYIESEVKKSGKSWQECDLEFLDSLWIKAKALNL